MKYIAIDIGSSFFKSALFDMETYRIIDQNISPTPLKLQNGDENFFEIQANELVETVKAIIDKYTKGYSNIRGIVFSTQMHGFIYRSGGRNEVYISWQDTRCLCSMKNSEISYMEYLKKLFSREEMACCGVYIKPSLGLCNLFALLNGREAIDNNGELFTLGSYIIARLTGNNICHITNAAPLGFVDIVKCDWHREIIRKAGFENIFLPEIAKSDFKICGTYFSNGQELNVYPDFGDQQVAILGCMADKNDVVINIATASQITRTMENFIQGNYETRPYFEGEYIITISNMPGGRNLEILIDFLKHTVEHFTGCEVDSGEIWGAVLKNFRFNSKNLKVDMHFYPTPENINGGGIYGITPHNFDLNALFSAAFENMAYTYNKNIKAISSDGNGIERLVCSGGVSWKTPQLLDIISRITGYPWRLSAIREEVFAGLFRISLVCEGISRDLRETRDISLEIEGR